MQRAAVYVRVSTEEQARDGYSIEAQINTLEMYAKLYEYKVVRVYRDEGLSGKNMERPALREMLRDAREKVFDTLLVWKVSRLSRNLKSLLSIVDTLDSYGISFISHSEAFNTLTPVGRMTLQILGSIAEFERNTIIENVKLGLHEKAKRGEWLGGRVLGYKSVDKKLVLDERKAKIVRDIFRLFYNGESIYKITQYLNQNGYKTVNNKDFASSSVVRILGNPIYKGYLRHNVKDSAEYFEVKGSHEPIVSEKIFDEIQLRLNKGNVEEKPEEFELAGLLKCPHCSASLVRYKTSSYRYYRCSNYHNYGKKRCRGFLINAEDIEKEIMDKIKALLKEWEIQRDIYDNLGIKDIFHTRFNKLETAKRKKIYRYLIDQIILTKEKELKEVIFKRKN